MPKDLPSSLQQHGRCYRSAFYVRKLQLPSGHTNAAAEAFHSTLEFELLRRYHFTTRTQARQTVANWIDEYNTVRRHSTNGMLSPVACERARAQANAERMAA